MIHKIEVGENIVLTGDDGLKLFEDLTIKKLLKTKGVSEQFEKSDTKLYEGLIKINDKKI